MTCEYAIAGTAVTTVATTLATAAAGAAAVTVVEVNKRRHLLLCILEHGTVVVLERGMRIDRSLGFNVALSGRTRSVVSSEHALDARCGLLHV